MHHLFIFTTGWGVLGGGRLQQGLGRSGGTFYICKQWLGKSALVWLTSSEVFSQASSSKHTDWDILGSSTTSTFPGFTRLMNKATMSVLSVTQKSPHSSCVAIWISESACVSGISNHWKQQPLFHLVNPSQDLEPWGSHSRKLITEARHKLHCLFLLAAWRCCSSLHAGCQQHSHIL